MPTLQERGYEKISMDVIDDARLGALYRAMGKLTAARETEWREATPVPRQTRFTITPTNDRESERARWFSALAGKQAAYYQALAHVVSYANGKAFALYSGEFAVFKADEPKLYVGYYGHNDDVTDTGPSIHTLYAFDDFAKSTEGEEIVHLAIQSVSGAERIHRPNHTLGSIPDSILQPYLRP